MKKILIGIGVILALLFGYNYLSKPKLISPIPIESVVYELPTAGPVIPTTCPTYRYRTGATCRDGWSSEATGRGSCSHHGGVAYWTYGSYINCN